MPDPSVKLSAPLSCPSVCQRVRKTSNRFTQVSTCLLRKAPCAQRDERCSQLLVARLYGTFPRARARRADSAARAQAAASGDAASIYTGLPSANFASEMVSTNPFLRSSATTGSSSHKACAPAARPRYMPWCRYSTMGSCREGAAERTKTCGFQGPTRSGACTSMHGAQRRQCEHQSACASELL
jgi:hypothetical protein